MYGFTAREVITAVVCGVLAVPVVYLLVVAYVLSLTGVAR